MKTRPGDAMLSVVAGRAKGTILWRLAGGPARSGALGRSIPRITEPMLIRHLRELVEEGILLGAQKRSISPLRLLSISQ